MLWELRRAASADVAELLPPAILPGLLVNPAGSSPSMPSLLAPCTLNFACNHVDVEVLLDTAHDGEAAAGPGLQIASLAADKLEVRITRLYDCSIQGLSWVC